MSVPSIPNPKLKSEPKPTIEEIVLLWRSKVIGTIEFRNWLAVLYPSFALARRSDVDEMMEKWAEEKEKMSVPEESEEDIIDFDLDPEEEI